MTTTSHPACRHRAATATILSLIASSGIHAGTAAAPPGPGPAPAPGPDLLGTVDGGFCGTPVRPEDLAAALVRRQQAMEMPALEGVAPSVVPLAFHIVRRSNGTGGLSLDDLQQSIDDLQLAFADTSFIFCTPFAVDFIDSDAFHDDVDTLAEINQLRETNVRPTAINVWFTPNLALDGGLQLCGISSFTSSPVQGIVMRNSCSAEGGNGSTLAHEVGHYFDLLHTHETALGVECPDGSNCSTTGDLICDTPADPRLGSDNVDPDSCAYIGGTPDPCDPIGLGYDPDPSNHMSYAPHPCRTTFTPQQVQRMRTTLLFARPELAFEECPELVWETDPRLEIVSTRPDGAPVDGAAYAPSVSDDGRYLVFVDESGQYVAGDEDTQPDVVLLDRHTGARTIVSTRPDGSNSPGLHARPTISGDGRWIAFVTTDPAIAVPGHEGSIGRQLVVKDRETGTYIHASRDMDGGPCDGWVQVHRLSRSGRFIAFSTDAPDLVPGDTPNSFVGTDIFLRDLTTGDIERISVNDAGEGGDNWSGLSWDQIGLSDDGRLVAFTSLSGNLVPGDTNQAMDVFVRDRERGTTRRASVTPDGQQANGYSHIPILSDDGRFLLFATVATDLIDGPDANGATRDLVVIDLETNERVVVGLAGGEQTDGFVNDYSMSGDARWIGFTAIAGDLDPLGTPSILSAYLHDRVSGRTRAVSPHTGPFALDGFLDQVFAPSLSRDGSFMSFTSPSVNLIPGDFDNQSDVYAFTDAIRPTDVDDDGLVAFADVLAVLAAWGPCPGAAAPCPPDVNGDGAVGIADVLAVLVDMD